MTWPVGADARPAFDPSRLAPHRVLLAPEQMMLREGPVRDHAAVVEGSTFRDVGPLTEVAARHPDLPPLAMPGVLMMPGFIDAHHHLTQSFGKALAFGEPSEIFRRVWVPLEGALDDRLVYLASKLAALEALRGGFTTVVDAGARVKGGVGSVADATREAGLRCVLGFICNDRGREGEGEAILARAEAHLDRYGGDGLVHPSLAISIPEAASDAMLRDVARLSAARGAVFQTHVNEHLVAVERSLVERGLRPIEHLDAVGALGPQTILAHATLVTPRELRRLRETDTAVAYNPVASQWKGNAVAPAEAMHEAGIRFGLGTDGTRSDGFRLVDAAEATQRIAFGLAAGDFSTGGGWVWMDHATAGGAEAVGLGGVTGAIAPGLEADYLLVDIDVPELSPSWDLTWELVRLGNRDQITAVVVAGRLRLLGGWPVDWDGRALMREVAAVTEAAVAAAPIHRVHPVSSEHRRRQVRAPRMSAADLALVAICVLAASVQATIGVGFALIVAPVAAVVRPDLLPGSLILLMIPLNAWVAWRERSALDVFGTTWITAGRGLGTLAGLWVLLALSARGLALAVGASTILAVLASILAPSFRPGRLAFATAGLVTGVTETATGIGGPPLALVFQHQPPPALRANVATSFLIGEILSVLVLILGRSLTWDQVVAAVVALPAVAIGIAASGPARRRLDARRLRLAVLGFALVSSVVIMLRA